VTEASDEVMVRLAQPDDVPALVDLFHELDRLQREWRVFTPRPGFYAEVEAQYRHAMEHNASIVLAADDGGEIVGMAYAEIRAPSRASDEQAIELSSVVVRSGHRGRGVGRALVREVARFAAERGIHWIELKTFAPNQQAMEFWRGLGFSPRVVQLTAAVTEVSRRIE
jgi:ribosomal protein S18 acetylase RimI-like enzyme